MPEEKKLDAVAEGLVIIIQDIVGNTSLSYNERKEIVRKAADRLDEEMSLQEFLSWFEDDGG